jgi:hypothetical protein
MSGYLRKSKLHNIQRLIPLKIEFQSLRLVIQHSECTVVKTTVVSRVIRMVSCTSLTWRPNPNCTMINVGAVNFNEHQSKQAIS